MTNLKLNKIMQINILLFIILIYTLRILTQINQYQIRNSPYPDIKKMRHLGLICLCLFILIYQSLSHLLLPPFLPTACINQYYEQKFKISQLDNADFKISGLPKDIFWTSNGTIFGKPSVSGEWKLNVSYDSVT